MEEENHPFVYAWDGVEYQNRASLMVYSWGSLLQQMSSLSSHFYIAGFSCTLDGTWEEMMVWICWSFAALQHGYHPTHDPEGKPLKKDSPFFIEKGKPLAHGLCGVLWVVSKETMNFSVIH